LSRDDLTFKISFQVRAQNAFTSDDSCYLQTLINILHPLLELKNQPFRTTARVADNGQLYTYSPRSPSYLWPTYREYRNCGGDINDLLLKSVDHQNRSICLADWRTRHNACHNRQL